MDNISSPLDSHDFHEYLDRAGWQRNSDPQTFTVNYVYTLPLGRGQQFANSISPLEDALAGGDSGISAGKIYGPRYNDWGMSFSKGIRMAEGAQLQVQAQLLNIFNHVNFQPPNTNEPSGTGPFGYITSDLPPRIGQFGLTLSF